MNIRFTLVAEGSTDAALLPILKWAVGSDQRVRQVEPSFAEPGMLPPKRHGLPEQIRRALELFPADLLFVHRDADRALVVLQQALGVKCCERLHEECSRLRLDERAQVRQQVEVEIFRCNWRAR